MVWVENKRRFLTEGTPVRIPDIAAEGRVGLSAMTPVDCLAVLLDGMDQFVFVPYDLIEVLQPEPPVKEYRETDYYMCGVTGAVYKRQYTLDRGYDLICLNQIKPSILCPREDNIPVSLKRLYKEV